MKKKYIIITLIVIVCIALLSSIIIFNKIMSAKEEDRLYKELEVITKDYYKYYYYYNVLGENDNVRRANAEVLKSNGIKISLEDLSKFKVDSDEILNKFKNNKTKSNCDFKNTSIVIYPVEPYGDENIRLDSNIVCGI